MRRLAAVISSIVTVVTITACDQVTSPAMNKRHRVVSPIVAPPIVDPTMGSLSPVARHIVIALRDPAMRTALRQALVASSSSGVGLDLADCGGTSPAAMLLTRGEELGGSAAVDLCALITRRHGVTLYMNRTALAGWDGSVIPVVTAIENPAAPLPATFQGYRSPTVSIQLPGRGRALSGPLLVVLPIAHPSEVRRHGTTPFSVQVKTVNVSRDSARAGS